MMFLDSVVKLMVFKGLFTEEKFEAADAKSPNRALNKWSNNEILLE